MNKIHYFCCFALLLLIFFPQPSRNCRPTPNECKSAAKFVKGVSRDDKTARLFLIKLFRSQVEGCAVRYNSTYAPHVQQFYTEQLNRLDMALNLLESLEFQCVRDSDIAESGTTDAFLALVTQVLVDRRASCNLVTDTDPSDDTMLPFHDTQMKRMRNALEVLEQVENATTMAMEAETATTMTTVAENATTMVTEAENATEVTKAEQQQDNGTIAPITETSVKSAEAFWMTLGIGFMAIAGLLAVALVVVFILALQFRKQQERELECIFPQ